jgi:uncharacterized protein Yka (UPF0111/DUF47 family)
MKNFKPTSEQSLYVSETVVEIKDCLNLLNWLVEGDKDLDYLKNMLASVRRLEQDMDNVKASIKSAIILKHVENM